MVKIYTAHSVKTAEENAFSDGISADELMYNAGCAVADELAQHIDVRRKNVLILCGSGNNGGDGFVCATRLCELSAFPFVCLVGDKPKTKQAKNAYKNMPEEVTVITEKQALSELGEYDIIIDAIFGFGFHGALDEHLRGVIDAVNSTDAIRVAIDVPSGAECDSGHINGSCFNADLTVTFTREKPFCYLYPARKRAGTVVVRDVGLPLKYTENETPFALVYEKADAVKALPTRDDNSNKGTFGSLLCATGSQSMMGAAILSAKSALKSGIGLLYQLCDDKLYGTFVTSVPEAVCTPLQNMPAFMAKAKAIVCGCGMGKSEMSQKILKMCISRGKPMLLDADALNIIAENDIKTDLTPDKVVITPHPAEAGRLLGISARDVQNNRFESAQNLRTKYNCTVLLKGANTIITAPDKTPVIIPCANSGLAKGGSGDTLSGIIGGLLAQTDVFTRTCLGAFIHARAGEICRDSIGEYSMLPTDLINALPQVYTELSSAKPVRNYFTKE